MCIATPLYHNFSIIGGVEPVNDIPPCNSQMLDGGVPNARSAKLQIVCRLNMSKTAILGTFTI